MKKYIVISICFVFIFQVGYSQFPHSYIPLATTNPKNDFEDLKKLDTYFQNVQVVGMGESTHGTHEFFTMRHRVFKYLVEQHGFTTFFLEADFANCLRIERYIHGAEDDLKEVTAATDMWTWNTQEMADLIEWIRNYNLSQPKEKLHFVGVDMQRIIFTIQEIDQLILKYDSTLMDTPDFDYHSQYDFLTLTNKEDILPYWKILENRKSLVAKLKFSNATDEFNYQTLLRHFEQILEEKNNPKFYGFRDLKMGENLLYHLEKNPSIKGFFWAHNAHVSNLYKKKRKMRKSLIWAGGVIRHALKEKYMNIGLDFDQGSFNAYVLKNKKGDKNNINNYHLGEASTGLNNKTLGYQFRESNDSVFFIPLSQIPKKQLEKIYIHNIGANYIAPKKKNKRTNFYLWKGVYDAMILVKDTKATTLLREKK